MRDFMTHAQVSGSEFLQDRVSTISRGDTDNWTVHTSLGQDIQAKRIILATGNKYKHLDVPGEKEYL
jgi:thioredoxin reductase